MPKRPNIFGGWEFSAILKNATKQGADALRIEHSSSEMFFNFPLTKNYVFTSTIREASLKMHTASVGLALLLAPEIAALACMKYICPLGILFRSKVLNGTSFFVPGETRCHFRH